MNSAPFAPNSSCATSQGSRSSGAPTRDGSGTATEASAAAVAVGANASRPGSFASRLATKYSGLSARQRACVCRRRSSWHASALQTRCRSPWRLLGKYHRRQIRHGRLRFTSPSSTTLTGLEPSSPSPRRRRSQPRAHARTHRPRPRTAGYPSSSAPRLAQLACGVRPTYPGHFSQADPGQFSRALKSYLGFVQQAS
jgi:hypothetical protein